MRGDFSNDRPLTKLLFGSLWVLVTAAVIAAGMTSLVFTPDSAWKSETNVWIFWISLAVAAAGLFLQARHDFAAFCFGSFWYAMITAIITGAVAILGEDSHPIALLVAVVTGAFAAFSAGYVIWAKKREQVAVSVYDKAKWHVDSVAEHSLPMEQAYVHGGMFLAWALDCGLASEFLQEETPEAVSEIRSRARTGAKVLEDWDGVLIDDLFDATGNAFAQWYFGTRPPNYSSDFEEVLCSGLPSSFHVIDTWENFDLLKARIDQRFKEWEATKSSSATH